MNDHTKTAVLPENVLAKRMKSPRDNEPPPDDFDKTVVLEDELASRRDKRPPKPRS